MSDRIAARYTRFAEVETCGSSPLYESLSRGVAADPDILTRLATLPEPKQQPNLLYAAARMVAGTPADFPVFRSTVLARWDEISVIMLSSRTQTNEPGRCGALYPLLASFPQPLALIEVGASAGLCLFPDRYRYVYGDATVGDPGSPLTIPVEVTGAAMPAPGPIDVVWRAGIDLNPLDVTNDADVAWLETLIWPEHEARRARLQTAIGIARTDPPRIVGGDLLEEFAALAAEVPADATLVVFHAAVLTYVPEPVREAFADLVLATRGHWISQEAPGVVARAVLPPGSPDPGGNFVMSLDATPVALTAPHGGAIHWLS
jgi:hypothetical protein